MNVQCRTVMLKNMPEKMICCLQKHQQSWERMSRKCFWQLVRWLPRKSGLAFSWLKKICFFHTFRGKTTGNPCRKTRNRAWNKSYRKQGRIKCMVWKNMQLLNSSPCGKVKTKIKVVENKWKYALCRMKDQFWICKLFS